MEAYARYSFVQSPVNPSSYILKEQSGNVSGLTFPKYTDISRNVKAGIANKSYIIYSEVKSPSIRKYFPKMLELGKGFTLSGIEELNIHHRTFGDTKKLGTKDLILVQFSDDMQILELYFIRDKGWSKDMKTEVFSRWDTGEGLVTRGE